MHLAIPVENQQISGYQAQVMMPADKDWMANSAPVLLSEKEVKQMDEVAIAQPVYDPNQLPGVAYEQPMMPQNEEHKQPNPVFTQE